MIYLSGTDYNMQRNALIILTFRYLALLMKIISEDNTDITDITGLK